MKRLKIKRFFIFTVILILSFSPLLSACGAPAENKDKNSGDNSTEETIKATDIDLVINGYSDYKIVIPKDADEYVVYAKDELCLYLKKATGADFSCIIDNGLAFNEENKYISLGKTTVLSGSGETVTEDNLLRDGYIIKRKGNTLLLCGGGSYGTLYSVYGFLNKTFGWEAYSVDEIYYKKGLNFKVLDFNITDVPAIPTRTGGWWVANDPYLAAKWRTIGGCQSMLFDQKMWYYFPHTTFKLVNPSVYGADHPDWYAQSQKQPCFTSEGFRKKLVENAKQVILKNPALVYLPLGAEDSMEYCMCENCQNEIDTYGFCGLIVRWVNKVVEDLVAWMDEEDIDRDIKFPILAYYGMEYPPITKNANGEYVPVDASCVLHEKAPVLFAPMNTQKAIYPINDAENNAASLANYKAWKVCSSEIMFYMYAGDDMVSFDWMDCLYTFSQNIRYAVSEGATYYWQDSSDDVKQSSAFQTMTGYVYTKLLWNPDVNINGLVHDFMINYFKEASEEVEQYYYLMKAQFKIRQVSILPDAQKDEAASVYPNSIEYMNRVFMEQMENILAKGIEKIKAGDYTDEEKEKYIGRIELESMTPKFFLLDYYYSDYTDEVYYSRIDEFEYLVNKYGIQYIMSSHQGITNERKLQQWRDNKNG